MTVIRLPVERIFGEGVKIKARRKRFPSKYSLRKLLRHRAVEFAVADVGAPLKWIEVRRCYEFWKSEIGAHFVHDHDLELRLDDFPGEYAYVASEWFGRIQTPVDLLGKDH